MTRKKLIYEKPQLFDFRDVRDETVLGTCRTGYSDASGSYCNSGVHARRTCGGGATTSTRTCNTGTVAHNRCGGGTTGSTSQACRTGTSAY
jgi:hypothetical protein